MKLRNLEKIRQEPSFTIDYIFGDLSPKEEREFERYIQRDELLHSFVQNVILITIAEALSKQALLEYFSKSKIEFANTFNKAF